MTLLSDGPPTLLVCDAPSAVELSAAIESFIETQGSVAVWRLAVTLRITDEQAVAVLEHCVSSGELVRGDDWDNQASYARTYGRPEIN